MGRYLLVPFIMECLMDMIQLGVQGVVGQREKKRLSG